MINQDNKESTIEEKHEEKQIMTDEDKNKFAEIAKKAWDTFHKYVVYMLITCLIGVWIGISVSKIYYNDKLKECILLQGMVIDKKPYTLIPK